jgi:hypothetical protein
LDDRSSGVTDAAVDGLVERGISQTRPIETPKPTRVSVEAIMRRLCLLLLNSFTNSLIQSVNSLDVSRELTAMVGSDRA